MSNTHGRYARQELIDWWNQERLDQAAVIVCGAGALGNEVLKNLALVGVGRLVVIDFDLVESSNLSRCALFRKSDLGRPKAVAAAEAISQLNPDIAVEAIHGDIRFDIGLGEFRHSDLAIGCVDTLAARIEIASRCALTGIPHLDGGMHSDGGELRWFSAGEGACYACTLSADDLLRADQRNSCTGFQIESLQNDEVVATVATTAAIVGGLLGHEAVRWLCGCSIEMSRGLVLDSFRHTLRKTRFQRRASCSFPHYPYASVLESPKLSVDSTARDVLAVAAAEHIQNATAAGGSRIYSKSN